jgi:hypothetical protein
MKTLTGRGVISAMSVVDVSATNPFVPCESGQIGPNDGARPG